MSAELARLLLVRQYTVNVPYKYDVRVSVTVTVDAFSPTFKKGDGHDTDPASPSSRMVIVAMSFPRKHPPRDQ